MQQVIWVENAQQFKTMCDELMKQDVIALDTEFIRRNSFYPNAALFQFATRQMIYLVDPLQIEEWDALKAILVDAQIVKVIHACWEDLEVFYYHLGIIPQNVIDTQLALAFANIDWSMGYHRMIDHLLNIQLPKDATLSNWLKRPLTEKQIVYAQEDVQYLHACYDLLKTQLDSENKWPYLQEQCAELIEKFKSSLDVTNYYKKIKTVYDFSHQQQTFLQALCIWRDTQAQQENKPRSWIVDDKLLIKLALKRPQTEVQMLERFSKDYKKLGRYSEALMQVIENTQALDERQWPVLLDKKIRFKKGHSALKWRVFSEQLAESLNISSQLLLSKDEFFDGFQLDENKQWKFQVLERWPQWKRTLIAPKLEQWINQLDEAL